MAILSPHILFVNIHPLDSEHKNWNLELLDALKSRSIQTTCLSILKDSQNLSAQLIAETYTHVCFLLLGDYPTHHRSLVKFIETSLSPALKFNPRLRILNSPRIVQWNSDKKYLRDLAAAGIAVPETAILNALQPLEYVKMAILSQSHGSSVVVKPSISASGARTHRVENPQELSSDDDLFLTGLVGVAQKGGASSGRNAGRSGEGGSFGSIMLQEYIPEIASGEYSLCYVGGRLIYTVLKRPRAGGWQVSSGFGGTFAPVRDEDVPPEAKRTAENVLQFIEDKFAGDKVDYARVDGILREDGRFVLMEIELIEPALFLSLEGVGKSGVDALCDAILNKE